MENNLLFRTVEQAIYNNNFNDKNVDFTVTNSNGEDLLMHVCKINIPCEASFQILFYYELRMIELHPQDYDLDTGPNYDYTNHRDNNGVTTFMWFLRSKLREGVRSNRMWSYFVDSNPNLCDPTGRNCLWHAWFHYYRINNSLPSNPIKIIEKVMFMFCREDSEEDDKIQFMIDINHKNIYDESFLHEVVAGFRESPGERERWYPDELKAWRYRLVKQLIKWGATVTQTMIDQCTDTRVKKLLLVNV